MNEITMYWINPDNVPHTSMYHTLKTHDTQKVLVMILNRETNKVRK